MTVRAVMFFADDPAAAARWWAGLRGVDLAAVHVVDGFAYFDDDGLEVGFHPADDERNPRGGAPVVYWAVESVAAAREAALAHGARHHRGPLVVDSGRAICQLVDPFGAVFGLDGPP